MTAITPEDMFYRMHPEMAPKSELANLRLYCEKVEREARSYKDAFERTNHTLGTFRAKASGMEAERDIAIQAHAQMQLQMWTAQYGEEETRKERDEARQWARRYYKQNKQLRNELAAARNAALDEEASARAITGALKSAIDAHGPIDKRLLTSATKRIVGALKANTDAYPADEMSMDAKDTSS